MRLIQLTRCGGADGFTPHIGENDNWWLGTYDTGVKADYSSEEATRVQQEELRVLAEGLREQAEEGRALSEVARQESMILIERSVSDALRSMSDISATVTQQGEEVARQGEQAESQGNRAEQQGAAAGQQGDTAQAQGETAARQGEQAESQGNRAEQQGAAAGQQGDTAQAQGETAARQGMQAEQQGNKAEQQGKAAEVIGAGLDDRMNYLENLTTRQPTGLRFNQQDGSVRIISPKINLGYDDFTVEGWISMVKTVGGSLVFLGAGSYNTPSTLGVYSNATGNYIHSVVIEQPLKGGPYDNYLTIDRWCSNNNLTHIVITRSGTRMTAIVNGRSIRLKTVDRVLDFSQYVYAVQYSSFFALGRVFNYAMSQTESNKLLWNGGRCDETCIPSVFFRKKDVASGSRTITTGWLDFTGGAVDMRSGEKYTIEVTTTDGDCSDLQVSGGWEIYADCSILHRSQGKAVIQATIKGTYAHFNNYFLGAVAGAYSYKISLANCLLEYLPSSIRKDRIINTGTLGRDHDGLFSKLAPEVIYEPQYKDKDYITAAAPNYPPIAMGQEVYSEAGNAWKACLPPMSREWGVNDWKQINNG